MHYNNSVMIMTNMLCCMYTHVHEVCVKKMRAGASVCCDSVNGVLKAPFTTQKLIGHWHPCIYILLGELLTLNPRALLGITSTPSYSSTPLVVA